MKRLLKPLGRSAFLRSLDEGSAVLDVGCGESGGRVAKAASRRLRYTGIDIEPRTVDPDQRFILTDAANFSGSIGELDGCFEAIVSCHNIEHCDAEEETLRSMARALKSGGRLYISTPSEKAEGLPSRYPCLNYFDDKTHKRDRMKINEIVKILEREGLQVEVLASEYRPLILRIIGLVLEVPSRMTSKCMLGTWELHGFESVAILKK
jgi:2-polyprenyl-3-methyl-5-hydroxy-6-metoxy-1,4-benzoquinol methylase